MCNDPYCAGRCRKAPSDGLTASPAYPARSGFRHPGRRPRHENRVGLPEPFRVTLGR